MTKTKSKIIKFSLVTSFFLLAFAVIVCLKPSYALADSTAVENVFGEIEAPAGVSDLNAKTPSGIGLLLFISNAIKFASIVAGVWVLFNFITAGFTYITGEGDKGAYEKIGNKLTMSVTGLILIVAAYTIMGILSLIIFGDPTYIINPQIPSAI